MKKVTGLLVLLLGMVIFNIYSQAADNVLVFKNGFLIDGTGKAPVQEAVVVLEGDLIKSVGAKETPIPVGARVIDLEGKTILPGFINAHIHGGFSEDNLKAWARGGVTTVRDLSTRLTDPFKSRDIFNLDNKNARLVSVGPMLATVNGYGALEITSPEDARTTVKRLIEQGADLIKVGIEDQQGPNRWPLISIEEIRAIVETAHLHKMKVSAHVTRMKHLKLALEGGVDELAHMIYDTVDQETIDYIVDQDIYWIPTLELWDGVSKSFGSFILKTAQYNLGLFINKGGKVALGTDYAGFNCEFELGMPMKEIRLMAESGMTAMQIIVAATQNAAYVCGLSDKIGTIEEGKAADLLVIEGNPLSDLEVLLNTEYVVHNGEIIVGGK